MALYLGGEKLAPVLLKKTVIAPTVSGDNFMSGTAVADDNGVITFPELSFTPTLIAAWNVKQRDLKAEAEAEGNDWEDGWTQYVHNGVMLFAIYQDETWVSQAMTDNSGGSYISNETFDAGSCVDFDGVVYSYRIMRFGGGSDYADETFNYLICG